VRNEAAKEKENGMRNEKHLPEDEPLKMIAVSGPAEAQMIEEMLATCGRIGRGLLHSRG